ncbi:MAG: hypothetical protein Q9218_002067 [Villophora microphyllina]
MEVLQGSLLKAPAVEVVPLPSHVDSADEENGEENRRDTSSPDGDDGSDDDRLSPSTYEDMLDGMPEQPKWEGGPSFPDLEESIAFRKRLRLVGEDQFITETIEAGAISARKLCTAFGIRAPPLLEGQPDHKYYPLLGIGIDRELRKRNKLPQYNTIDDVVDLLRKSKNIIVLTGAGISTSLGIPDFRSKDTGLYSQLQHLGLSDPQEVFDIGIFWEDPSIFYSVAKGILPSTRRCSPTHAFIKLLQDKGKLLTNFTQNIDDLESHADILPEKLIQCHGSFATATCVKCEYRVKGETIFDDIKAGRVPRCDRCIRTLKQYKPFGIKRKRSTNGLPTSRKKRQSYEDSSDEEEYDIPVAGPDITFFGEDLPETFHDRLIQHDKDIVDLVLVIGTSLKVAPVSEVSGVLHPETPQIYISREPCQHIDFDIDLLGECDTIVTELCRRLGWDFQHEMVKEDSIDVQLHEGYNSRYSFKVADVRAAIRYLFSHDEFRLFHDANDGRVFRDAVKGSEIVLVGHSVGATIAFALAMGLDRVSDGAGDPIVGRRIKAVVGVEGVYDFTALRDAHMDYRSVYEEFTNEAFGAEKDGGWKYGSMVKAIRKVEGIDGVELVVLGHSTEDELVEWHQVELMKRALQEQGWHNGEKDEMERKEFLVEELKGSHDAVWEKGEELARCIKIAVERCIQRELDRGS